MGIKTIKFKLLKIFLGPWIAFENSKQSLFPHAWNGATKYILQMTVEKSPWNHK